jgi:hypothetical protein
MDIWSRKNCLLHVFIFLIAFLLVDDSQASEGLLLKITPKLHLQQTQRIALLDKSNSNDAMLGTLDLFRGVEVGEAEMFDVLDGLSQAQVSQGDKIKSKEIPRISAIHGGLKINLQQNLSLVYTPGRLASKEYNSESLGLYLLSNRGGMANWFMGIESTPYANTADTRQTSNTAQLGVIFNLD